ncbi:MULTISPECIES: F0F1 ATP synthase subunit delta [Nocardiaceae]|uniref:ATP synthase subunit delta n=1 Tax=Rhodococcoides kroppenstedtii TaxID=293050 RepID=A0ABS7NQ62_9NOCA|nr:MULTISPECIES: F0F1 ATP synthase subunit delta [Rhodococcus]AMY18221.1 ATP synthase subunit delta [Rhodococcus sp. PBTS 1]MBY6313814.1 F0F1 ATP synthase subunit delta [Rhodococcus kroppenstedtii]MBY6320130.1 F0F1 ATP synthase subunit delta [Rhodococcus kroppenstedtii]MBY6399069.1 F0F1 ATP synthase subunit delta [Rhodococcus kroppenstedtii]
MYAASREALAEARTALTGALDAASDSTSAAAGAGSDLFAVVRVLDAQRPLRSALADASASADSRRQLAERLFDGKVGSEAVETVKAAVAQNWSSARDLTDSLVLLGREALLRAAEDQDQLGTVEDELFRLGRIIAGDSALEQALSDRTKPAEASGQLLKTLLYGKVTAITEALAIQAVGRLTEAPAEVFGELSALAATRRNKEVAYVRSSTELSTDQVDRLTSTLEGIYGKSVTVHVEVDRDLLSGLVVRVGDEVIDGSGAGRLAQLRKSLK